jgi:hypothetical protein
MLGAATYEGAGTDPVSGTRQSWGAGAGAVNPQMAAFYAARNARNSKAAYDALNEGEAQIDRQVSRAGALQGQATNYQNSQINARKAINPPSKTGQTMNILTGATKIAKDLGLFESAGNWLGDLWNGSGDGYGGGASDFDLWYDF